VIEECASVPSGHNVRTTCDPRDAMTLSQQLPAPSSQLLRLPRLPPGLRITATALAILLFLTSSPPLLAITMGQIRAGSATPGGGGQGSFSNLQNAGAASAKLTAELAQGNLKKANDIIIAMRQAQADARKALPDASSIPNGLKPGGLEPYVGKNGDGSLKSGFDLGGNPITDPTKGGTWSGASIAPTAPTDSPNTVNITQSQQNAYLYWNTFNVGQNTKVNFNLADNLKANTGQNIAFNKVMSPSDPSHIFGKINAQGQVYILNQNGILFHNGSAVNTLSLVASTLPINENLSGTATKAGRGIANNPDYQFLFSALEVPAGKNGPTEEFKPTLLKTKVSTLPKIGNVIVERGASISSQEDNNNSGGLVALVGPNVRNEGIINTPNGQTILAAGLEVGLTAHSSADPSLRGFDVFVGKVSDGSIATYDVAKGITDSTGTGGSVINAGIVSVPLGNVTMAGRSVAQNGVIDSLTSVSLNGRIDLQAIYDTSINTSYISKKGASPLFFHSSGLVEFGGFTAIGSTGKEQHFSSLSQILPDWNSKSTVIGQDLALKSIINVSAKNIHLSQGAVIVAPGASSTSLAQSQLSSLMQNNNYLDAGVIMDAGRWMDGNDNLRVHDVGQIYLDAGAVIDASGSTDVAVSSAENFITLQLRGPELSNSPLQRDSPIRGKDITVDIRNHGNYYGQYWVGTPLGDATGYVNLIQRTVGELTTAGGEVSMQAGSSIVIQGASDAAPAASINVSGGWLQYTGGSFGTTKLISGTGQIVDISKATPDQVYTGFVTSSKTYESPYFSGGDGGSLTITAPSLVLDGAMHGIVVQGLRQTQMQQTPASGFSRMAEASKLGVHVFSEIVLSGAIKNVSPNAPTIVFQASLPGDVQKAAAFSDDGQGILTASRAGKILLDPELASSCGFGNLSIDNHDGNIVLPETSVLSALPGSKVMLNSANAEINGSILVAGGDISIICNLANYKVLNEISQLPSDRIAGQTVSDVVLKDGVPTFSYSSAQLYNSDGTPARHLNAGVISLGFKSRIDTSGVLTDISSGNINVPNGGNITITAFDTNVKDGTLDVSGGASVNLRGSVAYGNAGRISLSGGVVPGVNTITGGALRLGAVLEGYAGLGAEAGSLSIFSSAISIGKYNEEASVLNLTPAFFDSGGFGKFTLSARGTHDIPSIKIGPQSESDERLIINPRIKSYVLSRSNRSLERIAMDFPTPWAPAPSVTLNAVGLTDLSLKSDYRILVAPEVLINNTDILLDPQAITSANAASGKVGRFLITGASISNASDDVSDLLKSSATIFVQNSTVRAPGGIIELFGANKYPNNDQDPKAPLLSVEISGSSLEADGSALYTKDPVGIRERFGTVLPGGKIQISGNILADSSVQMQANGTSGVFDDFPIAGLGAYRFDSAGGSISLSGGEMLYTRALISAKSGGKSASGGSLKFSSGRFYLPKEDQLPTDLNLEISQAGPVLPKFPTTSETGALGTSLSALPGIARGGGHIGVDQFTGGGFDSIALNGNIVFTGSSVKIDVPGSIILGSSGAISADSCKVNLVAPYVSIGEKKAPLKPNDDAYLYAFGTSSQKNYLPPVFGSGELNVDSSSIDLGNISLIGIGNTALSANSGGIRGFGAVVATGELEISASAIYPSTEERLQLVVFNHYLQDISVNGTAHKAGEATREDGGSIEAGKIIIKQIGKAPSILTAGGALNIQASSIEQSGTLLAPFGTILVGSTEMGAVPIDPVSGIAAPITQSLSIINGRESVSANGAQILYGLSTDGTSWVDYSGNDITSLGLRSADKSLQKTIKLSALSISVQADLKVPDNTSVYDIDASGGGDLVALRWVSGLGGTMNWLGSASGSWSESRNYSSGDLVSYQDPVSLKWSLWSARNSSVGVEPGVSQFWSKLPDSYAILPSYSAKSSPTGYEKGITTDPKSGEILPLAVGSSIWINGGGGLSQGSYSLLPAIYASLPGAYLVSLSTPNRNTQLPVSLPQLDGSFLVSGSLYNGLNQSIEIPENRSIFSILPPSVINKKVDYVKLQASTFFNNSSGILPQDGGKISVNSRGALALKNRVDVNAFSTGLIGSVDISTPKSISIGSISGDVFLDPKMLNERWNYGSLLIGGYRGSIDSSGATSVTVSADRIALGEGVILSGSDIILAAMNAVQFDKNSGITTQGTVVAPDKKITVSGDGVLVRISDDEEVSITREISKSSSEVTPQLSIGENVSLQGTSLILDSSSSVQVDPSSKLIASSITIDAGKVVLVLDPSKDITQLPPLVLAGSTLDGLSHSKSLNITSYSTLDIYGSGSFGSEEMISLGLHAGEIRGFDMQQGTAAFLAQSILLDNAGNGSSAGSVTTIPDGSLEIDAATILLGKNSLAINQFANVLMNATGVVAGTSSGTLFLGTAEIPVNLYITTPIVTATAGNSLSAISSGDLILQAPDLGYATTASLEAGAGASLNFTGSSISLATTLSAPSGQIRLFAKSGDVNVGGSGAALLDVSGVSRTIQSLATTADAGTISILSDAGNVNLGDGASLNLSASGSSSAGILNISAPSGFLTVDQNAALNAMGGPSGGANGSFSLDVSTLDSTGQGVSLLASIIPQLAPDENGKGGFTKSLSFRIRNGDVDVDTYIKAASFSLSADQGSIHVTSDGVVDASGITGGSIAMQASGSVILEPNSFLSVHGDTYDNAGKGGSVFLSAGTAVERTAEDGSTYLDINRDSILNLITGSSIDLGITSSSTRLGQSSGILHLRAPVTEDLSEIQISPLDTEIMGASSIVVEGYRTYDLTGTTGEITSSLVAGIDADASSFFGSLSGESTQASAIRNRLIQNNQSLESILHLTPGVEIINRAGNINLIHDLDMSTMRYGAKLTLVDNQGNTLYVNTPQDGGMQNFLSGNFYSNLDSRLSIQDSTGKTICSSSDSGEKLSEFLDLMESMYFSQGKLLFSGYEKEGLILTDDSGNQIFSRQDGAMYVTKNGSSAEIHYTIRTDDGAGDAGVFVQNEWKIALTQKNPGYLNLTASGDINFSGSLSDGFGDGLNVADRGDGSLASAPLLPLCIDEQGIKLGAESWSYQISAGKDLKAASFSAVYNNMGSLKLGVITDNSNVNKDSYIQEKAADALTSSLLSGNYQVIRTGSGNISIVTGADLFLMNQFSTIYTAGTRVTDQNLNGAFDLHDPNFDISGAKSILGKIQSPSVPQYSYRGGNISITSRNISHVQSLDGGKSYIQDSSRQLPINWLSRRGSVESSGLWTQLKSGEVASTTWWVNFSNFFEGIGALGGGNISLEASGDINNIDASIPTQARISGWNTIHVQAGDSLKAISKTLSLSLESLADLNGLQVNNLTKDYVFQKNGSLRTGVLKPAESNSVETGGGDITIRTGGNLNAGVYYVESGNASLKVSGSIISNKTRDLTGDYIYYLTDTTLNNNYNNPNEATFLPTSFFLGKGGINISANNDVLIGPVGNAFLQSQSINDGPFSKTYFSSYSRNGSADPNLTINSLSGNVVIRNNLIGTPAFQAWQQSDLMTFGKHASPGAYQPWIRTIEYATSYESDGSKTISSFGALSALFPSNLSVIAPSGSITIAGDITLSPSKSGNLILASKNSISGIYKQEDHLKWGQSTINLSDADPAKIPTEYTPLSVQNMVGKSDFNVITSSPSYLDPVAFPLFESLSYINQNASLQLRIARHDQSILHLGDNNPVEILTESGDISDLKLFMPKMATIVSGGSLQNLSMSIQNNHASDVSVVSAVKEILLYNKSSDFRSAAQENLGNNAPPPESSGDIQISGPGALLVTAGGNIDLGNGPNNTDGTGVGITSIGNARNPALPFEGADIQLMAGVKSPQSLKTGEILSAASTSKDSLRYFKEVGDALTQTGKNGLFDAFSTISSLDELISSDKLSEDQKNRVAMVLFDIILRDAGRDHNDSSLFTDSVLKGFDGTFFMSLIQNNLGVFGLPSDFVATKDSLSGSSSSLSQSQKSSLGQILYSLALKEKGQKYADQYANGYLNYKVGEAAISDLFGSDYNGVGSVITWSRDIRTKNGGSITINAPGGGVTLANTSIGSTLTPPGVVTEYGGAINIFTRDNVDIGIGRIFTLRGGDIMIWSDKGNIAAGSSAKTVASAPPTRVLIDPQSGSVLTDLAGLATGGGIGVLATVKGAPVGNVDLIAPSGIIDAGDAGIRSSGNLNLAATKILNADNIAVGGISVGAPPPAAPAAAPPAAAPPAAAPPAAASTAAAANNSAAETASKNNAASQGDDTPSIYSIDILGYGGGEGDDEEKRKAADASVAPIQASL